MTFLLLVVQACATETTGKERSTIEMPTAEMHLTVLQPLPVPPGTHFVHLQEGKALALGRFDVRRPTCRLELPRNIPAPEQIMPATFDVTNVGTTLVERGRVSGVGRPPIESEAPVGMGLRRATVNLQTRVDFETGLRRMTCAYWAEAVRNQPPNLTEIRDTLGDLARLE